MNPQLTGMLIGLALAAVLIYRRVRRNFGRQALSEPRLYLRCAILAVLGALILRGAVGDQTLLSALLGGAVAGAALGYFALRHTSFESTPEGRFYTPHTYFGLVVTALVLGRLVYRYVELYQNTAAGSVDPNPYAAIQRSPLTLAIFGVLIGYYLLFNVGVLRRARSLPASGPAAGTG